MIDEIQEFQKLDAKEFAELFDCPTSDLPLSAVKMLESLNTDYRSPTRSELDIYLLDYLRLLRSPAIVRDTDENHAKWLDGWKENLQIAIAKGVTADNLRPRYFRGNKYLRLRKDLVVSPNLQLEHDLFTVARHYLFQRYLSPFSSIYEFGCGSGQNLFLLSELFPDKEIVGLDWVGPFGGNCKFVG